MKTKICSLILLFANLLCAPDAIAHPKSYEVVPSSAQFRAGDQPALATVAADAWGRVYDNVNKTIEARARQVNNDRNLVESLREE